MKTSKNNIRYIVVHSSKTLPEELYISIPYHYIIHRNGNIEKSKKISVTDACVQIAYLGGVDKEKHVTDTRTDPQTDSLFNKLVALSERFPEARIVGADEVFGKTNDPGFNVKDWLKNYTPKILAEAA